MTSLPETATHTRIGTNSTPIGQMHANPCIRKDESRSHIYIKTLPHPHFAEFMVSLHVDHSLFLYLKPVGNNPPLDQTEHTNMSTRQERIDASKKHMEQVKKDHPEIPDLDAFSARMEKHINLEFDIKV